MQSGGRRSAESAAVRGGGNDIPGGARCLSLPAPADNPGGGAAGQVDMRLHAVCLLASLSLAAGCAQKEAVVVFTVTDATPPVPIRALQTFEIHAGRSAVGTSFVGGDPLIMPNQGSMSFFDDTPPPFRLCVIARGQDDDVLLHAVSDPIQPILEETIEVVLPLTQLEPGGEVPEPCGSEVEPWPDGF